MPSGRHWMTRILEAIEKGVLRLRLENDDGIPRIERAILRQINREMERLDGDNSVQGCLINGSERAFAGGAEISEVSALSAEEARAFSRLGQMVFRRIAGRRKPVIAAIRGYCIGGGLDLALACHARIAAPDAIFGHPGGALGILTGWGGTQRLRRLIGRGRALDLLATGRRMDAEEARECGLVRENVPSHELEAAALRLIGKIGAARSPR